MWRHRALGRAEHGQGGHGKQGRLKTGGASLFLTNSNLKVFRRPCFNLQLAPSPVRRERAGERVVLRIARI
ncbi:hypothetical protein [Neisseria sicca]|uniref:hypothetical protein n=1 Tax=Neisseria sicca TaxID=490 RepID=UPI0011BD0625|nr:hypothetical protein [Neisseria sicca]